MQLRNFVLITLSLLLHLTAFAQFKKGTRMVGSSVLAGVYNSGTTDVSFPSPTAGYESKTTSYNFTINPNYGWFITENTAIGVTLILNPTGNKTSFESGGTTFQREKENVFSIGLGYFTRYYFSSSDFMPFVQGAFNLGLSSLKRDGFTYGSNITGPYKSTSEGKSTGGIFANSTATLGLTKLLNPHTGLDFYIGYTYSYNKHTFKGTTNTDYGLDGTIDLTSVENETRKFTNHGFQVGIGFQVFLDPR